MASAAGRQRPRSPHQAGRRWVVGSTGHRRLQGGRQGVGVCRAEGRASAVGRARQSVGKARQSEAENRRLASSAGKIGDVSVQTGRCIGADGADGHDVSLQTGRRWRRRQLQGVGVHAHHTRQGGGGSSGQQGVGGCRAEGRASASAGRKAGRLHGGRQSVGSWQSEAERRQSEAERRRLASSAVGGVAGRREQGSRAASSAGQITPSGQQGGRLASQGVAGRCFAGQGGGAGQGGAGPRQWQGDAERRRPGLIGRVAERPG